MSGPVVLNHRGTPEPSSEVQRRLAAVHPSLSLRFIDGMDTHWAICFKWEESDLRWASVQSQEIDPNRSIDMVGFLPMDCSPDEAAPYFLKEFRQHPNVNVQALVDRMVHYNATAPIAAAMDKAMGEVLDNPFADAPKRRGRPPKSR